MRIVATVPRGMAGWSVSTPLAPSSCASRARTFCRPIPRDESPDAAASPTPARDDVSWLAPLKEEKKAGRVRYIGVQVITDQLLPQVEAIMRNEPIDFIGVNYDVSSRQAEEKILPLAQERKIGVMVFFPFNNARGLSCTGGTSLFSRVANKPLPEWAAEFDAKSWSQFFTKYVLSHPAVTVVRTGTTKAAHMLDNIGGGIGRLPNEVMRKRMVELIDSLPRAGAPA